MFFSLVLLLLFFFSKGLWVWLTVPGFVWEIKELMDFLIIFDVLPRFMFFFLRVYRVIWAALVYSGWVCMRNQRGKELLMILF